jgi:hypothetical protein
MVFFRSKKCREKKNYNIFDCPDPKPITPIQTSLLRSRQSRSVPELPTPVEFHTQSAPELHYIKIEL